MPAANLLWVSNSGNPSSGDNNLIGFLRDEGNTVTTVVDTNGPPNNYESLYDFVIISSNTGGSSAPGGDYTDSIIPVLTYQPYAADEMEISAAHSDRSNQTTINIVGAGHPLVAGFPNGDLVVTDDPVTFSAETTQGPGWVLLAEGLDGSVQYGYYDEGSVGNNGFVMPAKRAFFAVRSNAMTSANDHWKLLLNGFITWVLGVDPVTLLTADAINPASTTQLTDPITPLPNSVLYVALAARDSVNFPNMPVTVSGGGLNWTLVDLINPDTGGTSTQQSLYTATTGATPGTFPVTLTYTGNSARGLLWQVVQVAGWEPQIQDKSQTSNDSQTKHLDVEFDDLPVATSVVVAFTSVQQSVSENLVPSPGFTELSALGSVDNQYSWVQYIVGNSTQIVTHEIDGSNGVMGAIQVELAVGGTVTTITSVYDGASFVPVDTNVWDGNSWVPVKTKIWDGNAWVP
jgi:hypothetical protein